MRSAILLAGGASRRFGSDKLRATTPDGIALSLRAAATLLGVVDEVVAVIGPAGDPPPLPVGVAVVRDRDAHRGPLAGLATGLVAVAGMTALVVGADMPWLSPAVAALLLDTVERDEAAVAALDDGGRPRPMPIAVRTEPARAAVARLLAGGELRLRALLAEPGVTVIPGAVWRALDPPADSLRDVDVPSDLRGPEAPVG